MNMSKLTTQNASPALDDMPLGLRDPRIEDRRGEAVLDPSAVGGVHEVCRAARPESRARHKRARLGQPITLLDAFQSAPCQFEDQDIIPVGCAASAFAARVTAGRLPSVPDRFSAAGGESVPAGQAGQA
jgi:hypothetical protein